MNDIHANHPEDPPSRGVVRGVFWVFAAIAAFYLLTEHTAHVFGVLPWLLILVCPLMHVFMHHGHGHRHHHQGGAAKQFAPAPAVDAGKPGDPS